MTDLEIAEFVANISRRMDTRGYSIEIFKDGRIGVIETHKATKYRLKKDGAIAVEIPELSRSGYGVGSAQLALAVGRRLERFERGAKANATRTPNSRKEIAQNAIQTRWSAK